LISKFKYASLNSLKNKNISLMMSFRKYLTMVFIAVITALIAKMPVVFILILKTHREQSKIYLNFTLSLISIQHRLSLKNAFIKY